MASKSLAERIAAAKARKQAVAERLSALEAKAKAVDRKRDTRRKIIVGGVVLVAMEKDAALAAEVRKLLQTYVGRAQDKDVLTDLLGSTPDVVTPAPADPAPPPTPEPVNSNQAVEPESVAERADQFSFKGAKPSYRF